MQIGVSQKKGPRKSRLHPWILGLVVGLARASLMASVPPQVPACLVLGQPDFNTLNPGGASSSSLNHPAGVAVGPDGHVYVSDANHNRILIWASTSAMVNGQPASGVIGQPDFSSSGANAGGAANAGTLKSPGGIFVDSSGNLWVADTGNNRVLRFPSPIPSTGATADIVLGQAGSFTSTGHNTGGRSAASLDMPTAVSVSNAGALAVADSNNHRVLIFDNPTASANADRVFGQAGSFSTASVNLGNSNSSANSLFNPQGLAISGNTLWVSDTFNNRVLRFDLTSPSDSAAQLIGQTSFSLGNPNQSLPSPDAGTLFDPTGLALDSLGDLYVADTQNNRVLYYAAPVSSSASTAFGQVSFVANGHGGGSNGMFNPQGLALDGDGTLLVADNQNNRVLVYGCGGAVSLATSTPSPTASSTASPTATVSPTTTASPTASPSPTVSPSSTVSPTASDTPTASPSPTRTPSFSCTTTFSQTPTLSATPSATRTFSPGPSPTDTPTLTWTRTPLPTQTAYPREQGRAVSYPNPVARGSGQVCIAFPTGSQARIQVYDLLGRQVADVDQGAIDAPKGTGCWNLRNSEGQSVASGIYYYRVQVDGSFFLGKMTVR